MTATELRRGHSTPRTDSAPDGPHLSPTSSLAAFQRDPLAPVRRGLVHWCKQEPGRSVAAVCLTAPELQALNHRNSAIRDEYSPIHAYWKCLHRSGLIRRLADLLSGGPARHVFHTARLMRACQIATPEPLAWAVQSDSHAQRHYLLTAAIPWSETADLYLARARAADWSPDDLLERAARLTLLARMLRRLHDQRFDHRDLKLQNILCSQPGTSPGVWLLDLDGVRRWPWRSRARAVQNLSRLAVSISFQKLATWTEQLRFLKTYLGETGSELPVQSGVTAAISADASRPDWKWWWRAISRRAEQKIRQNARRGRPLS